MKLIILDHYSQASEWAAKYIRNRIIQFNPGPDKYFTLGLPTGALGGWRGCCGLSGSEWALGLLGVWVLGSLNQRTYGGALRCWCNE